MKKKKLFLSLLLILALVLALAACGDDEDSDSVDTSIGTAGLEYTAKDGSYRVTGYTGSSVHIVIPDTYNDVPVTYVTDGVFNRSDIQSVVLGSNIESVGPNAFSKCSLLKSVTFGSNMIYIGGFDECINLTSVEIPASVLILENGAFRGCTALESVTFPEDSSLALIDLGAFQDCTSLKELHLPASLQGIGERPFAGFGPDQTIYFPCALEDLQFGHNSYLYECEPDRLSELAFEDCQAEIVFNAD